MGAGRVLGAAMFDGALREGAEGVLVQVDVRPGAAATRITGYRAARRAVHVEVAARPERGEANRELAAFVARLVPSSTVRIVRGTRSRHKTVLIAGATRAAVSDALARGRP